jgi:hypothetical protein
MLKEVRKAVRKVPFEPFWIELSSGTEISVPHPDYILVGTAPVAVEDGEGVIHVLSPLHMVRIRSQPKKASS